MASKDYLRAPSAWSRRQVLASGILATMNTTCGRRRTNSFRDPRGILTVSVEQHASWVRNFNPLLAPGSIRWPTRAGVYEPLFIYDTIHGRIVPWLAQRFVWSENGRILTFTLRSDVKWSDGQPFTAEDVSFTFSLLDRHRALDLFGVWAFLDSVETKGMHEVRFSLDKQYVPGLVYLGHQPIVPKHIWEDVPNPVSFSNEDPVATGPFTQINVFENQIYEIGRNPNYWQKDRPALRGLRFPSYPGNDQATLGLLHDEIDWAGNFVPDVERIYIKKDPEHHGRWFPLVGGTVMLYANTQRGPLADTRVRKAISMAIDRNLLVKVAMYGYTRPADTTGLHDGYARFRATESLVADDWTIFNPEKANQLLDEAGYIRRSDGMRIGADGSVFEFDVQVVTGWSDWMRAAQVIARGLDRIGVISTVRAHDFSAYFDKLQKGDFALSLGWSSDEPSPYHFYRGLMASATVKPLGEAAPQNWHRFGSPKADALLNAFEGATDDAEQSRLALQLQRIFAEEAPAIPLFPNPAWAEFNSLYFQGFPSKDEPYAKPSPYSAPECLLVLTRLEPRRV